MSDTKKKKKPLAIPRDDLLSLLKTARPDDMIRITRYPDGTEMIELSPPWRPEKGKPEQAKKPPVPKYPFDEREKEAEVPDWLKEVEPKKPKKK
jgi:hypothetical protein